jgi:MoaA/NifB/PqqE/SkfB family radical SAM enzyme
MTLDEIKLEIEYLLSINPRSPGANFNHDPDCFARYCKMQERRILESVRQRMNNDEYELIAKIAQRAKEMDVTDHKFGTMMDVGKVHETVGLDLERLLNASDSDFTHDVTGITYYLNRKTGRLKDFFSPRCRHYAPAG